MSVILNETSNTKFYHVRIRRTNGDIKYFLDLTIIKLREILEHFNKGEKFEYKENWIYSYDYDINELSITCTDQSSDQIISAKKEQYGFFRFKGGVETYIFEIGENISKDFFNWGTPSNPATDIPVESNNRGKDIFIVHGHDDSAVNELYVILTELGLRPIVIRNEPNKGMTVLEKFEEAAAMARYAFILITPDDVGGTNVTNGKKQILQPRARQNVIFELGYFMGSLTRKKVCCIVKGDFEEPSDIRGIAIIQYTTNIREKKSMLQDELIAAKILSEIKAL